MRCNLRLGRGDERCGSPTINPLLSDALALAGSRRLCALVKRPRNSSTGGTQRRGRLGCSKRARGRGSNDVIYSAQRCTTRRLPLYRSRTPKTPAPAWPLVADVPAHHHGSLRKWPDLLLLLLSFPRPWPGHAGTGAHGRTQQSMLPPAPSVAPSRSRPRPVKPQREPPTTIGGSGTRGDAGRRAPAVLDLDAGFTRSQRCTAWVA